MSLLDASKGEDSLFFIFLCKKKSKQRRLILGNGEFSDAVQMHSTRKYCETWYNFWQKCKFEQGKIHHDLKVLLFRADKLLSRQQRQARTV